MLTIQVQGNDISYFEELETNYPQYMEVIRPDSLFGANEIAEVVLAITTISIPVIGKVLISLIKNKKISSIKYKGIEINGITEQNVDIILNKLLERETSDNGSENDDRINTSAD